MSGKYAGNTSNNKYLETIISSITRTVISLEMKLAFLYVCRCNEMHSSRSLLHSNLVVLLVSVSLKRAKFLIRLESFDSCELNRPLAK